MAPESSNSIDTFNSHVYMQILGTWDNNKQGSFADSEERGKINFSEMGIIILTPTRLLSRFLIFLMKEERNLNVWNIIYSFLLKPMFLSNIYLCIWLHWVLVIAYRIFVTHRLSSCGSGLVGPWHVRS